MTPKEKRTEKKLAKRKRRLNKARSRKKKEFYFKKNHFFIASFWKKNIKPLIMIISVLGIIAAGTLTYSIYSKYETSAYWKDHHDKVAKMSDLPPSLLYDKNEKSRVAKLNFLSIYREIYNDETLDFKNRVDDEAFSQLQTELADISDDEYKQEYAMMYNSIKTKWALEQKYRSLYSSDKLKALKSSVTPLTVVKLNAETFEELDTYSKDSQNNDQFALRMYTWQQDLLSDAIALQGATNELSRWLTKDNKDWVVQPDLYPAQFEKYSDEVDALTLNYKWKSMNNLYAVIDAMRPITKIYADRHDVYNKVQSDQQEKRQALLVEDERMAVATQGLNTAVANIDVERKTLVNEIKSLNEQTKQTRLAIEKAKADKIALEKQQAEDEIKRLEEEAAQSKQDEIDRLKAEEDARKKLEDEAKDLADKEKREAAAREKAEKENAARIKAEEEARQKEEQEKADVTEEKPADQSSESIDSSTDSSKKHPILSKEMDKTIGKTASSVFPTMSKSYTYERKNVDASLVNGVIKKYIINLDGSVHFYIGKK